jgi:hypothetical protein
MCCEPKVTLIRFSLHFEHKQTIKYEVNVHNLSKESCSNNIKQLFLATATAPGVCINAGGVVTCFA